jgi:V/A-type H+/Na+-transporting ATPase subunit D
MASMNIKPTRSELIKLKRRIKLAKGGHTLLKKKRDGLILEFFEILKKAKSLRKDLFLEYRKAQRSMAIARSVDSDLHLQALALAVRDRPDVQVAQKNVMGVRVPKIDKGSWTRKQVMERGFGIISGSSRIDEAAEGYEAVVQKVIELAETETAMKRLLHEIETTKRRVNALEFKVIPEMNAVKSLITMRLEEAERENIFRMKRIKKKAAK